VENWAYNVEYVDLRNGIDTVQKDGYHDSGIFAVADPGVSRVSRQPPFRLGAFFEKNIF